MDKLDKKIITVLGRNARISMTQLAKTVNSSREVVSYRVKKLEEDKIIKGYYSYVTNKLFGIENYSLFIKLQNTDKEIESEIHKEIKKIKNIKIAFNCKGYYDISLVLGAKSRFDVSFVYEKISEICKDYLKEIDLGLDLNPLKVENFDFLITDFHYENKIKKTPFKSIDKKDKLIIKELSNNGNQNILTIANKVDLTAETTSKRIKNLIQTRAITGIQAVIDYSKLGYDQYLLCLKINNYTPSKENEIKEILNKNPSVVFARHILGKWDLVINILSLNHSDFLDSLDNIKSHLKEDLSHFEFSLIKEELKRKTLVGRL